MIDSPNLPSQDSLNALYGAWNPMSYMQGQQNQDLASQFRSQAFDANNNSVLQGQLQNQQSAAMNPLLQQSQALANTSVDTATQGKQIANQSAGLDLSSKQDLYDDSQKMLHAKLATEMSDEEYAKESNTYLEKLRQAQLSGNQADIQKYGSVVDTLVGVSAAKAAQQLQNRQLTQQKIAAGIQEAGIAANAGITEAGTHVAGQLGVAQMNNTTKEHVAELGKGLQGRAAELGRMRDAETDPAKKAMLNSAYQEAVHNAAVVGAYGSALTLNPYGVGRGADFGSSTQAPAPDTPKAPDAAVKMLNSNRTPEMEQHFQAKFGYLPPK